MLPLGTSALGRPITAVSGAAAQEQIFQALKTQGVILSDTQLVSLAFVCTLVVGRDRWGVVNSVEYVQGAQEPRARSQITLLGRNLRVFKTIAYTDQFPLFCRGATLYLHGDYSIGNTAPYGNALTFDVHGGVSISNTDPNALPIQPTARRNAYMLK